MNQRWRLSEFQYNKDIGVYTVPGQKIHSIEYSDGTKVENYILNAIKKSKDISDDSEELMQYVKDWPSYYHLGTGRSNILKALKALVYKNSKVLELGCGCGAVTRYFGENFKEVDAIEGSLLRAQIARERCRNLKNIRTFCSNFKYIEFKPLYDVVTLIGVLEYAPIYFSNKYSPEDACLTLLKQAKTALKPNGALIIAIENKIGIKYLSGCPEDHTGKIFEGVHGYPSNQGPITFSKKELEILLKTAGFSNISFYYCYPDYKFASTIISDIGDEKKLYLHNWIETPFTSYNLPRKYTFHEGLVMKTLSKAGLLRKLANSFLIIAKQDNPNVLNQPDWVVKRFSVKRHKKFQCVTTLKTKPKIYVEKKRLFGDNKDYIVVNNSFKIKHSVTNSPWHKGDLMIFDIFNIIFRKDFEKKILKLLKIYYQELISRYHVGINDKEGYPLLCGDSIDFIPRNIIKDNENLYCIDTEWHVADNIPIDYVMYRCIITDIMGSQDPWIRKKVKNADKSTIKLIKYFFPKYGNARHNKNKILEESIQNLVSGNLSLAIMNRKSQFLRNKTIWILIRNTWDKLPKKVKIEIEKYL
ncbi:MAG: class I SAM-dependent methyltransferase [Promethearchaeota archaeon]